MNESLQLQVEPSRLASAIDPGELPWAYGEDRITAIVRDPDSAYLYWEITDAGIAAARARLGPAGAHGWCSLRIYDTTGHDFNGTNANDYFDIRVERTDRDYFVMIRRPTSSMHVEIGIKTTEGYFQAIARSGRADFPRNWPSPDTTLHWMTVTSEPPPSAAPYRSRYRGPEAALPGRAGAGYVDVWRAAYAPSMLREGGAAPERGGSASTEVVRTVHRASHIERWWHLDAWRSEWRGGLRFMRSVGDLEDETVIWQKGQVIGEPFDAERIIFELLSRTELHLAADGTDFTVFGPWRVTMRSAQTQPNRRVLARWSVRWVVATTPLIERWEYTFERKTYAGYERELVSIGASEQKSLFERGASERWRIGASERLWLGASEWWAGGASETLWLGASQTGFAGASALLQRGASEYLGASERFAASIAGSAWMGGGSEAVSHRAPPETSEHWAYRPEES